MRLFRFILLKFLYFSCLLLRVVIACWFLAPLAFTIFVVSFESVGDIFVFYHELFWVWKILLVIVFFFLIIFVLFVIFILIFLFFPEAFDVSYKDLYEIFKQFVEERSK